MDDFFNYFMKESVDKNVNRLFPLLIPMIFTGSVFLPAPARLHRVV